MKKYTRELMLYSDFNELHVRVDPNTDLDSSFYAWDLDEQEIIQVNGWLFTAEVIGNQQSET